MRRDRNWPWHIVDRQTRETGKASERERKRDVDEKMESDGGPRRDRANIELFA